ncbi:MULTISPECIES: hypothetical protein [unclassified Microcoleus]|uniref:hypothetical protein n=1 Tax=unclassified Microcoleus TaxID=2642155 RepID=UPI002FD5FE55
MVDAFIKYHQMKKRGIKPKPIYLIAKADGLDFSARIRMLRQVFNFSLIEAKEVSTVATSKAKSLIKHQEELLPSLAKVLKEDMDE